MPPDRPEPTEQDQGAVGRPDDIDPRGEDFLEGNPSPSAGATDPASSGTPA